MTRPTIAPEVLAALSAAVPSRASKKLDADPRVAESWTWSTTAPFTVDTGNETVTLAAAAIATLEAVRCSCLLSPRCFHVLAVLSVLPLLEPSASPWATVEPPDAAASILEDGIDESQQRAAANAWARGTELLEVGLERAGTLRLAELLRAAHGCRLAGLPRLEAAVLGVFEAARDLRERSAAFRLREASASLAELLLVADRIGAGDPTFRGIARRRYETRKGLKLTGLANAPLLRKGYAGVISYFTDGDRVYSAQEVLPGDADRARDAVGAQLRFGEVSASHRKAIRRGLLFASAEVSEDGRLGAGKDVVCALTAPDPSLVERLFERPFDVQLREAETDTRSRLVFVRGVIAQAEGELWLSRVGSQAVPLRIPIDDPRFSARDNLTQLARFTPAVWLIARLAEDGTALEPIAARFETGSEPWFSFDYDRLVKAQIPAGSPPDLVPRVLPPTFEPLRRRVDRMTLAGARSLPGSARDEVAREAARLRESLAPTAADVLQALASSLTIPARAWLAAHVYLTQAERSLARTGWV